MNYAVKTDRITTGGVICDKRPEQTVDADIKLPDYCPDVQKILKCRMEPQIESRCIAGDRLEIEGTTVVRVIYVDAINNSIRCTEQNYPFAISENLPGSPQNAAISTDIRVSYLNCRALSPRRLNIHGAFTVGIRVTEMTDSHVCTHIKGSDIQQRKKSAEFSCLTGITQQPFSVTEALEASQNSPAVQLVVRSDIRAANGEYSISSGKLTYKGELLVKLLYLSDLDSGKAETMEYSIPFSQVAALSGSVGEGSETVVRMEVLSSGITLRNEIGFDNPLPVLSARLCLTVLSYERRNTELVTDCYSTLYKTEASSAACRLPLLGKRINETVVEKSTVELVDSSVAHVIDVWCESGASVCEKVGLKALLRGKYNVCVLAEDPEGSIIYTERTLEYNRDIRALSEDAQTDSVVSAAVISSSYRIASEKRIEVRTEISVTGELYESTVINALTGCTADENSPCKRDKDAALILCYAHKGDDIWEIARTHSTPADRLRADNDLTEDILTEDKMLILS